MLEPGFDLVHTVTDYYDGPRVGIADFEGAPHLYESEWDDASDEYATTYRLSPVDPQVFDLALEAWAIWRRWETAFHEGRTTQETHPALPAERRRSDELNAILRRKLRGDPARWVRVRAEFQRRDDYSWSGHGWPSLQVRWSRV